MTEENPNFALHLPMMGDFLIKPNSTAIVSPSEVESIYADAAITAVAFGNQPKKAKSRTRRGG